VPQQSIGFIGLGNLGLPMVANLTSRSWRVVVHDPDADRTAKAREAGGEPAENLRDLAACDYVCLAVPDGAAATNVLLDQGLLDAMPSSAVVCVHSTVLPRIAVDLAERCAARGVAFLDAPVSGGAARARSGELTTMVGASADSLQRGRVVLEQACDAVVHVGPPGAGAAVKLANQLMLFSALAGTYEAMSLAQAYGVDEDQVLSAVGTGTGASWASDNWGFYDKLSADYDAAGVPPEHRPWSKDLVEVVRAAADQQLPAPLAALLSGVLPVAVRRHADQTRSALEDGTLRVESGR
jgi:3-hydroxyisobutyrate dehydrogenase-like beta-hydroxyacid dehydrogenase